MIPTSKPKIALLHDEVNELLSRCGPTPVMGPAFHEGPTLRVSLRLFPQELPRHHKDNPQKMLVMNPYPVVMVALRVEALAPCLEEGAKSVRQAEGVIRVLQLAQGAKRETETPGMIQDMHRQSLGKSSELMASRCWSRADFEGLVFMVFEDCGGGVYRKVNRLVTDARGQAFLPDVKQATKLRFLLLAPQTEATSPAADQSVGTSPASDRGGTFFQGWRNWLVSLGSACPAEVSKGNAQQQLMPLRFEYPVADPSDCHVEIREHPAPGSPELIVLADRGWQHQTVLVKCGQREYSIKLQDRDARTDRACGRLRFQEPLWNVISQIDEVTVRFENMTPPVIAAQSPPQHDAGNPPFYAMAANTNAQRNLKLIAQGFWEMHWERLSGLWSLRIKVLDETKTPYGCARLILKSRDSTTRLVALRKGFHAGQRDCLCQIYDSDLPPEGFDPSQAANCGLEAVTPETLTIDELQQLDVLIHDYAKDLELSEHLQRLRREAARHHG